MIFLRDLGRKFRDGCTASMTTRRVTEFNQAVVRAFRRTRRKNCLNEQICAQMNHMPIQSPEEIAENLGRRIRARRLSANLSQAVLADKAGISRRALVQLEGGQGSTVRTLICVLKALGLAEQLSPIAAVPTVSPMAMLKASRLRSRAT